MSAVIYMIISEGAVSSRVADSIQVETCSGWISAIDGTPIAAHLARKFLSGAVVSPPRVRVADVRGEEFEEADRGALAGVGDERRQ